MPWVFEDRNFNTHHPVGRLVACACRFAWNVGGCGKSPSQGSFAFLLLFQRENSFRETSGSTKGEGEGSVSEPKPSTASV